MVDKAVLKEASSPPAPAHSGATPHYDWPGRHIMSKQTAHAYLMKLMSFYCSVNEVGDGWCQMLTLDLVVSTGDQSQLAKKQLL